ncbi:MAG: carboxymuconolactone decarboxylase family protein [Gemmatimonadaceae bacterium]
MARRQGATDAQLDAISRAEYDSFEQSWRSALRYADEMTPTPGIVSDATFAELAASWNATQIIEITAVICMFNFFNRFAHALEIPVTR